MMQPTSTEALSGRGRQFLLLANVSSRQTQGRLIEALSDGLRDRGHRTRVVLRALPRGSMHKLRRLVATELRNVLLATRTDVLIVHSSLALNLLPILTARLLRRPVLAFVWDIFPDSSRIAGLMDNKLILWLYAHLERLACRLATAVVVPSADYVPALARWDRAVEVLPHWPIDPLLSPGARAGNLDILRVAFAGRVDGLRALDSAIEMLVERWTGDRLELNLFTSDDPPQSLIDRAASDERFDLVTHGFLPPEVLQERLSAMDVGWVCLAPDFTLPAFPSKTMAYLSAGLPVVFSGPEMPALEDWITGHGFGFVLRDKKMELSPDSVRATRAALENRRTAYYESMRDRWFCFDHLL